CTSLLVMGSEFTTATMKSAERGAERATLPPDGGRFTPGVRRGAWGVPDGRKPCAMAASGNAAEDNIAAETRLKVSARIFMTSSKVNGCGHPCGRGATGCEPLVPLHCQSYWVKRLGELTSW